jgi:hypothetical protein
MKVNKKKYKVVNNENVESVKDDSGSIVGFVI